MPLIGAKNGNIPLLQQDILAVCHAVQGALIHIGQLRHGMGLTGEHEALLPFLVEEGVKAADMELVIHPIAVGAALSHLLRLGLGTDQHRGIPQEGRQEKLHPGLHIGNFIQIKILEFLTVRRYGQNGFSRLTAEPGFGFGAENRCLLAVQRQDIACFPVGTFFTLFPVRGYRTEALEGYLVQIPNHGSTLQKYK